MAAAAAAAGFEAFSPLWAERAARSHCSFVSANNGKKRIEREKEVGQGRTDGGIRAAPGPVFNFR